MKSVVFLANFQFVASPGRVSWPPARQGGSLEVAGTVCGYHDGGTSIEDGCAWVTNGAEIAGLPTLVDPALLTMKKSIANPGDTLNPGRGPWRSPGTAVVSSPCGNSLFHSELDGRDLPPNPTKTTWRLGSTAEVASTLYINHGGGWSFRLCPKTESLTEACFQQRPLRFIGDAKLRFTNGSEVSLQALRTPDGLWSRNLIPGKVGQHLEDVAEFDLELEYPMPLEGLTPNKWDFSIVEQIMLPDDLPTGEYVLGWRWDSETSPQVWLNCADVSVVSSHPMIL